MLLIPSFQGQHALIDKKKWVQSRWVRTGNSSGLAMMGEVFGVAAPAGQSVYQQLVVL